MQQIAVAFCSSRRASRRETDVFRSGIPIRRHGQLVAAVVLWVPAMAGDARDGYLMLGLEFVQLLPQVGVLDGRKLPLLTFLPAVPLPAGHPFQHAFANVFAV